MINKSQELYGYFQKKALENYSLFQVEIDVTSRCNANCPFCFQGDHYNDSEEMTFEQIILLLDQLRELGTFYIGFSGGEPFMRKDFIDILNEAKKRRFRISFISNGILLDKNKIDQIAEMKINKVNISFHGIRKETYMKSFGINNSDFYNKAIRNIDYMIERDIPLGIAITVTKYNINELEEITKYFLDKGLKENDINYELLLSGKREISKLMPTNADIKHNIYYLNQKIKKEEKHGRCGAGIISCTIDAKGNVFPCTFFNNSVGNVKEKHIKEIWEESHFLKILRSIQDEMFKKCGNCSIRKECNICLANNLNETGNIFMPSDMFCESRKARV